MHYLRRTCELATAFAEGWHEGRPDSLSELHRKDKAIREHLTEEQIDKMIRDTFPASDPVTMY